MKKKKELKKSNKAKKIVLSQLELFSFEELSFLFAQLKKTTSEKQAIVKNYMAKFSPSTLEYYGHAIPVLRSILKKELSLYQLSLKQQFNVMNALWLNTNSFDEMALSLFWLDNLEDSDLVKLKKDILQWVTKIDNWAHSDTLCSVLARIIDFELSNNSSEKNNFYLKKFNQYRKSKNPWLRRISIVGLIYYSRLRNTVLTFEYVIPCVSELMHDDHYYVQKAVGWVLRELYNEYPKDTYNFLLAHVKSISSVAWYAASEKLTAKEKNQLLKLRKKK